MTKPTIAYLMGDLHVGGIPTFLANLATELQSHFNFHFISTDNPIVNSRFGKLGQAHHIKAQDKLIKYLQTHKPDIVQYGNQIRFRDAAIKAKIPIIIERTAGPRSCNLDRQGVSHVISSAKGTAPLIRNNYNGSLSVIYNGLDLNQYADIRPNRLGFKDTDFVVVYAARYGRGQAFDVLIKAVIEARKTHDIKLILIGGPPGVRGAEDISKLVRGWMKPLEKHCVLTGMLDDPRAVMAAGDVYVCPARHHGISNSLIEASALGKPLIATDVGQTNEILHDGHNGYLVKVNDISEIKKCIIHLMQLPKQREQMGHYGKGLVEREFNVKIQAEKYRELYERLLNEAKK